MLSSTMHWHRSSLLYLQHTMLSFHRHRFYRCEFMELSPTYLPCYVTNLVKRASLVSDIGGDNLYWKSWILKKCGRRCSISYLSFRDLRRRRLVSCLPSSFAPGKTSYWLPDMPVKLLDAVEIRRSLRQHSTMLQFRIPLST